MKTLDSAFQAHLDSGATTLAWCWRVTRRDGVVLGFTEHDRALTFGGTTYAAEAGFLPSELRAGTDLAVDAQDAQGVIDGDVITEEDILMGLWDGAEVEVWRVNWADTSQRALIRRGTVGEIRRGRAAFIAEVRSLADVLAQPVGRVFQATCDAQLGDARCNAAGYAVPGVTQLVEQNPIFGFALSEDGEHLVVTTYRSGGNFGFPTRMYHLTERGNLDTAVFQHEVDLGDLYRAAAWENGGRRLRLWNSLRRQLGWVDMATPYDLTTITDDTNLPAQGGAPVRAPSDYPYVGATEGVTPPSTTENQTSWAEGNVFPLPGGGTGSAYYYRWRPRSEDGSDPGWRTSFYLDPPRSLIDIGNWSGGSPPPDGWPPCLQRAELPQYDGHQFHFAADGTALMLATEIAGDPSKRHGRFVAWLLPTPFDMSTVAADNWVEAAPDDYWIDTGKLNNLGAGFSPDGRQFFVTWSASGSSYPLRSMPLTTPYDPRTGQAGGYVQGNILDATGTIDTVDAEKAFVPSGLSGFAEGYFARGRLTWTGGANAGAVAEIANDTTTDGVRLIELLEFPVHSLAEGDAFTLRAGCDKTLTTCRTKFGNAHNFRGFPHMPGDAATTRYATKSGDHDGEVL